MDALEVLRSHLDHAATDRGRLRKLAQSTGVPASSVSLFRHGKATLSFESADRLARGLGLRLVLTGSTES